MHLNACIQKIDFNLLLRSTLSKQDTGVTNVSATEDNLGPKLASTSTTSSTAAPTVSTTDPDVVINFKGSTFTSTTSTAAPTVSTTEDGFGPDTNDTAINFKGAMSTSTATDAPTDAPVDAPTDPCDLVPDAKRLQIKGT